MKREKYMTISTTQLGNVNVTFKHVMGEYKVTSTGRKKPLKDLNTGEPLETKTICKIAYPDPRTNPGVPFVEFIGYSYLNVDEGDTFCKETGRQISLERALESLHDNMEGFDVKPKTAREIWVGYYSR